MKVNFYGHPISPNGQLKFKVVGHSAYQLTKVIFNSVTMSTTIIVGVPLRTPFLSLLQLDLVDQDSTSLGNSSSTSDQCLLHGHTTLLGCLAWQLTDKDKNLEWWRSIHVSVGLSCQFHILHFQSLRTSLPRFLYTSELSWVMDAIWTMPSKHVIYQTIFCMNYYN